MGMKINKQYGSPSYGLLTALGLFWKILTRPERKNLILLTILTISLAFVELVGVGSVMPFLAVASNPDVVETNRYLAWIYSTLGFRDTEMFMIALGIAVVVLVIFTNAYKLLVKYAQTRYAKMRGHELSKRLLARYLAHPYVFFLNQNSSDLSKNVLSEVRQVVEGFLKPLLDFATQLLIGLSIISLLVVVHLQASVIVAGSMLVLYGSIYLVVRKRLRVLGRKRLEANRERYKTSIEAMAGIKDVKLIGKERFFVDRYSTPSKKMARYQIKIALIGKIPNHALTALVNGGTVLAITLLLAFAEDFAALIPVLGVYIFAGNRLLPAFKHLFQDLAKVRSTQPVVELMFEHLHTDSVPPLPAKRAPQLEPLPFHNAIGLEDVWFTYPGTEEAVIKGLSLAIEKNSTVGFVGPTGCGKTTLIDIILGLLRPQAGRVCIDETPLSESNLRNWQGQLGYVPQFIYLSDDTVTRNIAFGIPDGEINMAAVRNAAEIANLTQFIQNELPNGFETLVGERGIRFSGGQRQRLGIARALYHDPEVLVMDEATSALDGMTESVIMEAIEKLTGNKTILLIAHRLTTLVDCDAIYMLDRGEIVAQGSYSELMRSSESFQQMARAGQ